MNNTLNASMNNLMFSSSDSINYIENNNSFKSKKKFQAPNSTNIEQNNLLIATNKDNNSTHTSKPPPNRIITFFRVLKNKICCNNTKTTNNKSYIYDKVKEQVSPPIPTTVEPIYYEIENPNTQKEHIYDEPY
jgi:hypothetical protein